MRNLDIKIDFISNPINNDKVRFKVTDNNEDLEYNSGQTIIDKTFRNTSIVSRDKISRYTSALTEENVNFGNFTGGDVLDIVPIDEYIGSPNNGYIVVGSFTHYEGIACDKAVRLDKNGNFINSFGTFNDEVLTAVIVDNFVVFGGNFTQITPLTGTVINKNRIYGAFWNGTRNNSFNANTGNGFNGRVYKLKFIDNVVINGSNFDLIIAGGEFTSFNGSSATSKMCSINKSGSNLSMFISQFGSIGTVRDIAVDYSNPQNINLSTVNLFAVGSFTVAGRDNIVKVNLIGNFDDVFDCNTDGDIYTVTLETINSPTRLYFGGAFENVNVTPMRKIAGVNKNSGELIPTFLDTNINGTVFKIEPNIIQNNLLIGGDFTIYGSAVSYFVQINRLTNAVVNDLLFNDSVFTICYDNIKVIVGGKYTQLQGGSATLPNIIPIGVTATNTRDNLLTNLNTYNTNPDVVYSTGINFINFNYEYPDFNVVEVTEVLDSTPRVIITITNQSFEFSDFVKDVRVRSPYLLKSEIEPFDRTNYGIWDYKGGAFDYSLYDSSYSVTKQKLVSSQTNTYIDFTKLVKDSLTGDIVNYLASAIGRTLTGQDESKWVYIETTNSLLVDSGETRQNIFYCVDGYVEENEPQSLPRILTSGLNKYYNVNSKPRIHFKTDKLQRISIINGFDITLIDMSVIQGNNREYIQSIPVYPTQMERIVFEYIDEDIAVNINSYDECKYPLYDIVFKNKYGFLETISFSKLSRKTLTTEKTSYTSNVIDLNGNRTNPYNHFKKDINVTGKERFTLNTDWVPEYINRQMEELFLSEEVYMVDITNLVDFNTTTSRRTSIQTAIKPVNLISSEFQHKTKLNEKLIQYTIEVELSHNKINNLI